MQNTSLQILAKWKQNGGDALTIPFLVGSYRIIYNNEKIDINYLFTDLTNNNHCDKTTLYLNLCDNLLEPVISIIDTDEKKNIFKIFPKYNNEPQILVATTETFLQQFGDTLDAIITNLSEKYVNEFNNNKLSKNGGHWGNYSDLELKIIMECSK